MHIANRSWISSLLILLTVLLCGCSQVIREGVREGKFIDSETVCRDCLISTETKMEFVSNELPNKIKIHNEATYGDTIRRKYEAEGYRYVARPPIVRTFLNKLFTIPFTAGLALLFPSYYTEPAYKCGSADSLCSYSTDTWQIENEYQYATDTINTYTKNQPYNAPITVSIFSKLQSRNTSTSKENTETKIPGKKVKKAKKAKKPDKSSLSEEKMSTNTFSDSPVSTQTLYAVDGTVEVDLCNMNNGSITKGEYRIRFADGNKNLESTYKQEEVVRYCPESSSHRVDKVFNQLDMPAPPK